MASFDFSEEQQAFLKHDPSCSARLVAGPGAGKSSTCVAYLAKHLKQDSPVSPRICMLTFTRAATAEFADKMREDGLTGDLSAPATLHSFALRMLRQLEWPGIPMPVRLADDWEAKTLIRPQLSRFLKEQGHAEATKKMVKALETEMAAGFESLDTEMFQFKKNPELGQAYLGLWQRHRTRLRYMLVSEPPYRAGARPEACVNAINYR
jgi:superfamily I DNA/RNA helicase